MSHPCHTLPPGKAHLAPKTVWIYRLEEKFFVYTGD
jgi:hypothetical protein